jgi:hypothetical protein
MIAYVQQHFAELDVLLQSTRGIGPIASASERRRLTRLLIRLPGALQSGLY